MKIAINLGTWCADQDAVYMTMLHRLHTILKQLPDTVYPGSDDENLIVGAEVPDDFIIDIPRYEYREPFVTNDHEQVRWDLPISRDQFFMNWLRGCGYIPYWDDNIDDLGWWYSPDGKCPPMARGTHKTKEEI